MLLLFYPEPSPFLADFDLALVLTTPSTGAALSYSIAHKLARGSNGSANRCPYHLASPLEGEGEAYMRSFFDVSAIRAGTRNEKG